MAYASYNKTKNKIPTEFECAQKCNSSKKLRSMYNFKALPVHSLIMTYYLNRKSLCHNSNPHNECTYNNCSIRFWKNFGLKKKEEKLKESCNNSFKNRIGLYESKCMMCDKHEMLQCQSNVYLNVNVASVWV